jgi:ligand-binding SRPBCC domain-containing protein
VSLIDQRILIAAPAEAVWLFLSDPTLLVKWNKGCKQIMILSTRTTGVGTRRRMTDENGRTTVEEITHWLDNLGYEYVMVDGPYRSYKGRVRLQAIPEGTIINWTVEYRLRGLFSGPRNLLSFRHRMESTMAESLRELRRLVERSGARIDPERQARFAMRAAPSVEARAAFASVPSDEPKAAKPQAPLVLGDDDLPDDVPPIEMTVPSVLHVSTTNTPVPPAENSQPKELSVAKLTAAEMPAITIPDTSASLADTKPRKPQGLREALAKAEQDKQNPLIMPAQMPVTDSGQWDSAAPTVPIALVAPPLEPEPETQTMEVLPPVVPDTLPEQVPTPRSIMLPVENKPLKEDSAPREVEVPPPTHLEDTGEISIWDVFGVVPPSERTRTDLEAIIASLQTPSESEAAQPPAPRKKNTMRRKAKPPVRAIPREPVRGKARLRACCTAKIR